MRQIPNTQGHCDPRPSKLSKAIAPLLVLVVLLIGSAPAQAIVQEEQLGLFGQQGSAAGEMDWPFGVATDPDTGEVFVTEFENNRVSVFDAWGKFLRAWGWGVGSGAAELETCSAVCSPGIDGDGVGQFASPSGIAVDNAHNVFVFDARYERVQKFSPSGEFLLMFGGEVNKTTGANVCTKADLEGGDECGPGEVGGAPGFFSVPKGGPNVALTPAGTILVGDSERIQEFSADGEYLGEIAGGVLAGSGVIALAVDSSGQIYAALDNPGFGAVPNVYLFGADGSPQGELKVPKLGAVAPKPVAIATDPVGHVYVTIAVAQESPERILEYSAAGELLGEFEVEGEEDQLRLFGLATNGIGTLYVSRAEPGVISNLSFLGPPPLKYADPPKAAPTIASQYVASTGVDEGSLRAQINPRFWADTKYYVEYGTGACSAGGCDRVKPVPPGQEFGLQVNRLLTTEAIHLTGLQPDALYHFRFVSVSSGGGPVYGVDPDGDGPEEAGPAEGLEGTFRTFPEEDAAPACPNDAFRKGAAALLPDCRAYEMVSPVDKASGDVIAPINFTGYENELNQSSLDGNKLTYSSYRAFADSKAAPYISQYLARRGAAGWSSESLEEARGSSLIGLGYALENGFKAFSPDLCQAWFRRDAEPQLAPGAVSGFPNLYRRENCPKSYEVLSTVAPPNLSPVEYALDLQGVAEDGSKAVFRINDKLTPDATAGKYQVYEASAGQLKLLCVLPGGAPHPGDCSLGSPGVAVERGASVRHAVSADGSRIYWSTTKGEVGLGKIYLRLNGTTTVEVSGKASSAEAQFWGASADGSKALFAIEDQTAPITALNHNLYEYDLATESATLLAGKLIGIAGAGEDLSRVYFASEEAIGGKGTAGKANLYLRDEGTITFIATLSEMDVRDEKSGLGALPSNTTPGPVFHAAHVTPDGGRLAFISTEPLSGFDNTDAVSGKPDSEVFTYAAETGELNCASCSPAGARPEGRSVKTPGNSAFLPTAGSLPLGSNQLYTPRALAEDGNRLFFTSYADLLPRDQNGKADVYEWELPGTSASCESEADPDFYEANGGCLFLISSGQSPVDSELLDSSPSGRDVFFSTQQSLLSQDPDLVDIYDARIEGGFPPPPPPPPPCVGEACQPAQPALVFRSPTTGQLRPGNPPRISCPKGKHRVIKGGKERCVKNKAKGHKGKGKKRAGNNGRAGR
jgi:DNA-binding beta-propeller fold protein YncE